MDEAPTTPGRYPPGRPRKDEVRPPKPPPRPRGRTRKKKEDPPPRPAGRRGAPKGPHRREDAGPLAAARIAKGLTLQEMAATTGVGTAMLSRLENGEVRPTRQTARRVAAGYGLSWARVMTICAGAPDEHIAVEWFRGRAAALRAEAAELEALADEMEGDDR